MKSMLEMNKIALLFSFSAYLTTFIPHIQAMLDKHKSLNVLIDTDLGADDAMAILMLLSKKSKAKVLCITCVQGNTGVYNASMNALLLLMTANRSDIPVYKGSPSGLAYKEESDNFYGTDGLGDTFQKPEYDRVGKGHAAVAMANLVKHNPGSITVLCLGPLTNIALATHIHQGFLDEVKELVIVGGSYEGGGNVRPGVEFNMYLDPEAAMFVFSKVPKDKLITLVPLETAENASFTKDWRINTLGGIDSEFMTFMNQAEAVGLKNSGNVWVPFDQLGAAIVLDKNLVLEAEDSEVNVETCGRRGHGAMFVDTSSENPNTRLVTKIDTDVFQKTMRYYMSD